MPRTAFGFFAVFLGELFALGIVTALIATIAFCCAVLNAAPLADDALNAADLALGFDWPAWCRLVAPAQPILHLAYVSLFWQMAASLCWFAVTNRTQRGREFMMITLLSMVPTVWALHTIPALGPLVDFGVAGRAPHVQTLLALRTGMLSRDTSQDAGFVCMPSFHTIWALSLIWTHRDSRWTFPIIGPLNFVMLVSLLSEGGHYLVDLIAGVAVAIMAIIVTQLRDAGIFAGTFHHWPGLAKCMITRPNPDSGHRPAVARGVSAAPRRRGTRPTARRAGHTPPTPQC